MSVKPLSISLLYRASWRYQLKHPLQLFFSILGVALGVAIVVGIDLAGHSARQGFYLSTQSIAAHASHQIVNSKQAIPEQIYAQLRNDLGLEKITPLIKQMIQLRIQESGSLEPGFQENGKNSDQNHSLIDVQLTGIDPFSEADIRTWQEEMIESLPGDSLQQLLTKPKTVMMESRLLKEKRFRVGESISLIVNNKAVNVTIIGTFNAPDIYQSQIKNWIISDISTAQEILNFQGYLSQIDLLLDTKVESITNTEALIKQIQSILPEGVQLLKSKEHSKVIARLSRSFELNLTALSLLGLLVAMFLIYNTMMFSVVQRRALIASLRVIGVTRKELLRLILTEAFIIALIAIALGIIIGLSLAQFLLYFVTRTINDLYYVLQVTQLHWSQMILYKAIIMGLGATIVAALIPALEAFYTKPIQVLQRSVLESKILYWSRVLVLPGLLGVVLVYLILQYAPEEQAHGMSIGFAAVFLLIFSLVCLLPFITHYLLKILAFVMKLLFHLPGKIAVNNIARSFSRSIVAIAALTVSVSAALSIGIMVDSFRFTVDDWLSGYLTADYIIRPPDNDSAAIIESLDDALISDLSSLPGVEFISSGQEVSFYLNGKYHYLSVRDIPPERFLAYRFKEGDALLAQKAWFEGDAVIISEPYAYHHGLSVGDVLELPIRRQGKRILKSFDIVGVYYHYGSEHGVITMSRATYNHYWQDQVLHGLGVYLSDEFLHDRNNRLNIEKQLQMIINDRSLKLTSKDDLHKQSLVIFDRTFSITNVLKLLVVAVSFVGILSALMAIELERAREFAMLRATGLTGKQLSLMVYLETLSMGIVAAVLALPMGIVLAYLLIDVINYRSFGWSMQFILPLKEFVMAAMLALFAALLAGIYPARHLSKIRPALALRGE